MFAEAYPYIRGIHIGAVTLSGLLFFLRGAGMATNARWFMAAPVRYASYAIDTVLLVAAMNLAFVTAQYPFVDAWLTVKLLLLPVYIVLGSIALKRGTTKAIRMAAFVAALLTFGFIVSVAHFRDPAGLFGG